MQYIRYSLWLLACLSVTACVNPPDYPDEPVIMFESVSKNQIYQFTNGPADSLVIQFSFTDGDGDLSFSNGDSIDIFLEDSRLPGLITPASLPPIPLEGTGNGISGDIFFTLVNTAQVCCIFNDRFCIADAEYPVDTFSYSIFIQDRAGNKSNTIRTEQIQILCLNQ